MAVPPSQKLLAPPLPQLAQEEQAEQAKLMFEHEKSVVMSCNINDTPMETTISLETFEKKCEEENGEDEKIREMDESIAGYLTVKPFADYTFEDKQKIRDHRDSISGVGGQYRQIRKR